MDTPAIRTLIQQRTLTGKKWESAAESFLHKQGLKTRVRNFNSRWGELDLVMEDGQCLVFVEVRYRGSRTHGLAKETVTRTKQRRIIRAAQYYLHCNPQLSQRPCRFDVVAIQGDTVPPELEWINGAFIVE